MNLFQIGLLFSLPVYKYLLTRITGYWSILYNDGMVNPEVVYHPSMAKATTMQANSLSPSWYG
jgi:hypothetical protein